MTVIERRTKEREEEERSEKEKRGVERVKKKMMSLSGFVKEKIKFFKILKIACFFLLFTKHPTKRTHKQNIITELIYFHNMRESESAHNMRWMSSLICPSLLPASPPLEV